MYAVVQTGGKQYRVQKGDTIRVEKLDGEIGSKVELAEVLMIGGDKINVGTPLISGAKVVAKITAQDRDAKIIVFKKKRRKKYRRRYGHRQPYTELHIDSIKG